MQQLYCRDDESECHKVMGRRRADNLKMFGQKGLDFLEKKSTDRINPDDIFQCSWCSKPNFKESDRGWFKCKDGCGE